jgi:hypothetical protein
MMSAAGSPRTPHASRFLRVLLVALAATLLPLFWATRARAEVVRVHVDSPVPVQLEGLMAAGWETMCASPCDIMLPAGLMVRVTGDDMLPSVPTMLSPGSRATLTVEPSMNPSRGGSITVLVLGSIAMAPIVALTAVAAFALALNALGCTHPEPGVGSYGACLASFFGNVGSLYAKPEFWGPAIPGAVALVLGIASYPKANTTPTSVRQTVATGPRWDVAAPPVEVPPVTSVPVWSGTF